MREEVKEASGKEQRKGGTAAAGGGNLPTESFEDTAMHAAAGAIPRSFARAI